MGGEIMLQGITTICFTVILAIIGLYFAMVTASVIATALGVAGWDWWIVFITMLGALGGCGGALINITNN